MTWPALPLESWTDTRHSLHMYAQIVGKIKLALTPRERAWANVPLSVSARGLTTNALPLAPGTMLEIAFDFVTHRLELLHSAGGTRAIDLTQTRSVARFYEAVFVALRDLGIAVAIRTLPAEVPNPIAFPDDVEERTYDPEAAHRFWQILVRVDSALRAYRAPFRGRHTDIQFFWGSFDLAYARFSGKPAAPPPNADPITRFAMDAEEIAAGFWFGDARFPEPALYCYAYPKPSGLEAAAIRPPEASWHAGLGEFVMPYEVARVSAAPERTIADFLASTYDACVAQAVWDPALLAAPSA